tara:strand:+ start:177 stop:488 length:312 start_codon:yes stop_codon:yes gene_type:complete
MSSSDIVKAIRAINKDAQIVVYGNDLDTCTIQWDVGAEISKADIQTKLDELQAEYDAQDYARKRKAAYPDIYDYMDGIVKDDQTQINKYIADCQAVKVRYKKG